MRSFDVLGIGNAIVDILSYCEHDFLAQEGLLPGSMTLINEDRAAALYAALPQATECSGGSAANTLAALASLGSSCAFIGKVRNDQLGAIFRHDMQGVGVEFSTAGAESGPSTARCLVFVTPGGQRTMATYLGACSGVREQDIDPALINRSGILYIEGYLWDELHAKAAIRKAVALARGARRTIAMTLSDTFCVERHRAEFKELIRDSVDILFANESELLSLTETKDIDAAAQAVQGLCKVIAVTRSEKGAVVVTKDKITPVPTVPVVQVLDTTGAGDLFAAGFLYGYTKQWDHTASARLGNACAGKIIQQLGARSLHPLDALVA